MFLYGCSKEGADVLNASEIFVERLKKTKKLNGTRCMRDIMVIVQGMQRITSSICQY